MDKSDREKELKELSHAIVEALSQNDEVMSMLTDLKDREVIDSSTLLGLALKISDLLEISGMAFTQDDFEREAPPRQLDAAKRHETSEQPSKTTMKSIVDGRTLSPNEVAFQEWTNDGFDEKEWLNKTGLIW